MLSDSVHLIPRRPPMNGTQYLSLQQRMNLKDADMLKNWGDVTVRYLPSTLVYNMISAIKYDIRVAIQSHLVPGIDISEQDQQKLRLCLQEVL
jgi:hypothetical protein